MYNVLIADDEKIIRDGIESIIHNYSKEYKLYHSKNGIEALQIICSMEINILILDIKMPIINGLDVLEKLDSLGYNGQIIVISGYDDFKYVHKAMKYDIIDYLLKPIKSDELIKLLESCERNILNQKQENFFYSNSKIKEEIRTLYNHQEILKDLINEHKTINQFLEKYSIESFCYYTVIIIETSAEKSIGESVRVSLYQKYCTLFDKIFSNDEYILIHGLVDDLLTILLLYRNPDEHSKIKSIFAGEDIQFGLAQSKKEKSFKSIYELAKIDLNINFYNFNTINSLNHSQKLSDSYPYEKTIEKMVESLSNLTIETFNEQLSLFLYKVCLEKNDVEGIKNLLIKMIYKIMSKNSSYISIISKYKFTEFDVVNIIQDASTALQLYQELSSTLSLYINEINKNTQSKDNYIIRQVKEYVASNFYKEIKLSEISQQIQMHPNYLSSYFKENTDQTFSQYLRSYRIEQSKKLMQESNLNINEIANKVGYNDNTSFYRAFKKETGLSPTEYQRTFK